MEIILAKTAGFCFGVKRAVDTVYEHTGKEHVYTYGPIIHNDEVVKDFASKGVTLVKDLSEYASTNVQETIAESYSDYYRNFGNAKPISKEIVKTLNNMLNTGVYEL